jgi:hypothetical protein
MVDDSRPECGEGDKDEQRLNRLGGLIMASDNFHPIDPCHFTGLDKWQRDYWSVLINYLLTFRARDRRSHKAPLTPFEFLNTRRRRRYQSKLTTIAHSFYCCVVIRFSSGGLCAKRCRGH